MYVFALVTTPVTRVQLVAETSQSVEASKEIYIRPNKHESAAPEIPLFNPKPCARGRWYLSDFPAVQTP